VQVSLPLLLKVPGVQPVQFTVEVPEEKYPALHLGDGQCACNGGCGGLVTGRKGGVVQFTDRHSEVRVVPARM